MERNGERREYMDRSRYLLVTSAEVGELFQRPPEVTNGSRWFPVADGVDPQDTVLLRKPKHDVFLAQWIAIPIIAEADDVLTFNQLLPPPPAAAEEYCWAVLWL